MRRILAQYSPRYCLRNLVSETLISGTVAHTINEANLHQNGGHCRFFDHIQAAPVFDASVAKA
jgi:hypothetical protein